MGKLQNASNNLEEILAAVVAGKKVQFKKRNGIWEDTQEKESVLRFLKIEWRVKPDGFNETLEKFRGDEWPATLEKIAKYFWDAAIDHQNKQGE